jgi:glycosyltransferase involved in cell wall biosynthesis
MDEEEDLLEFMVPAVAPRAVTVLVPAGLTLCSGRYRYDREIVSGLRLLGWQVEVVMLDSSFPYPDDGALEHVAGVLAERRDNAVILVEGLAFGAMADQIEREAHRLTIVGIVHHLLAAEPGLEPGVAKAFAGSEGRACRAASGLVATSFGTARGIGAYGVPRDRIAVAAPGTASAPRAAGSRNREGASPSTPVELLCVGGLVPRKGHDVLFDAIADLRHLRWHLTCVGSDTLAPDTVSGLREQIDLSGLNDAITLTGEIDDKALEQAYDRADVFVLATRHEGYGMAVAEALARGIPVVSTMAGAIPELVGHAGGAIVPIDDVAAFAAALEPMLANDATRANFAAGALVQRAALPRWPDAVRVVAEALTKFAGPEPAR